jgi:TPP-dependent pyruvate/acetoin dehydrogenase alpha subunit
MAVPPSGVAPRPEIEVYRAMVTSRKIEERMIRLYHQGRVYGGVYTGIGEEAAGAAAAVAAGPDDLLAPCIRNLSLHVGRGATPLEVFRQFLARPRGPTRGRDGNVHFGDLRRGVYHMISHLGAMLPVLVGAVMARRRQGRDSVGFAFIGDGGTSTGDFHEAVNFSAVFEVPVVVVIQNNQYAYSTPTAHQYRCRALADKAAGYGIEGHRADGNDALGLWELLAGLAADLRRRPRTVLVECETLRMRGHGEHDDFSYIPKELLAEYAARDPLRLAAGRLTAAGIAGAETLAALEAEVAAAVDSSYREALEEAPPDPNTLLEGVYAND